MPGPAADCVAICLPQCKRGALPAPPLRMLLAGVLLRSVAAASDEARVLRPDDILLRIDGTEVGRGGVGRARCSGTCAAFVLAPCCFIPQHRARVPCPRSQLGNDGTVPFRHGERVDFKYLVRHFSTIQSVFVVSVLFWGCLLCACAHVLSCYGMGAWCAAVAARAGWCAAVGAGRRSCCCCRSQCGFARGEGQAAREAATTS